MKKITPLTLIYILFAVANGLYAQDRTPFYVHGYGDDATQWANWRQVFNSERKMTTGNNTWYTSSQGVASMANDVAGQLNTSTNTSTTIYFGHSMGGVVGRHIDVKNAASVSHVGGYITAGSPLDGARIANNLLNGNFAGFTNSSLNTVLAGPTRQLGAAPALLYQVSNYFVKDLATTVVNAIITKVMPVTQTPTVSDLAENSAYYNSMKTAPSGSKPKVNIYGNENSPVLWRIASIAMGSADNTLVNVASQAASVYNTQKVANIAMAFLNPINAYIADGWAQGQSWFESGGENGWNDMIGASIPASKTITSQQVDYSCLSQCLSAYHPATSQQFSQCSQQCTQTIYYTYYSPVNGKSDGLIKAPSATGYNSAWNGTSLEALGVNHLEMKNHPTMYGVYNSIFDLTAQGVDPFFKTLTR